MGFKRNVPGDRVMTPSRVIFTGLCFLIFLTTSVPCISAEEPGASRGQEAPHIGIAGDMGEAAMKEAAKVKEALEKQAKSLFKREPLGWDVETAEYLYRTMVSIPSKIPKLKDELVEESRVLGFLGSFLILFFAVVVLYSLLGQRRAIGWLEKKAQPVSRHIPEGYYPHFSSFIRVVASGLIPLTLVGLFSLINEMIDYQSAWFLLTGAC